MRRGRHSRSIPQAPPCGLCFLGKWLMSYDLKRNLGLRPTNRPSVYSGRSFFFIAPGMRCLDIVWVVVSSTSAHSFWIPVVRHHIVIVCELFVANRASPILLDNLAVQQFPHFSWRPEFPISSRVMRILNALHTHPYYYCCLAFLSDWFPAAAE